ncbi:hypothetical protein [Pseudomonas sp. MM211]|uniref:hypothetical protein n=1 Tax=Pseudomonas sp. MM211 TaxID=2866808 RepID=UPI003FA7E814
MSPIRTICLAMAVIAASACSTPNNKSSNDVQEAAKLLIGQPASNAFAVFGKPDQGMGPSSYGSGGGLYTWNRLQTHLSPEKEFIKTGEEYVGEQQTWVTIGGRGMTGIMPAYSQPIYRDVGYYDNVTIIDYFCSITLFTDNKDIITDASVVNCEDKK